MQLCPRCGITVTTNDAYCDGVLCRNGHEVRKAQCDGRCKACDDAGRYQRQNAAWVKDATTRCPACAGAGRLPNDHAVPWTDRRECASCSGTGWVTPGEAGEIAARIEYWQTADEREQVMAQAEEDRAALEYQEPQPDYAVYAGGECLDGRYASFDDAALAARDVQGDAPDLDVAVDVSPEWVARMAAAS